MIGRRERWYFGFAVFCISCATVIAHTSPGSLASFGAVVGAIAVPLYGGALGKLWVESRNGSKQPNGSSSLPV